MRLSVSRTLPDTRRSSRRMLSSSGDAPSAISSSEMMAVVMDSSRSRLPESRPKTGVSVVLVSCSASYSRHGARSAADLPQPAARAVERAAAVRAGQDRADLSDAAKGRTALPNHQVLRVRGLLQPQLGLLVVVQRTKRAAFLLCRLRCRLSGQFFQYFVVFQCLRDFSPNLFISNSRKSSCCLFAFAGCAEVVAPCDIAVHYLITAFTPSKPAPP